MFAALCWPGGNAHCLQRAVLSSCCLWHMLLCMLKQGMLES